MTEHLLFPKAQSCARYAGAEDWGGFDDALRAELQSLGRLRRYARGATVLSEGEPPEFVGLVLDGVLRLQRLSADGRGAIVGLLTPPDMFGRLFAGPAVFSVEAATDVALCCCRRPALEAALRRRPELEHEVLLHALDELDATREWLMLTSGRTVMERVASFLLIFRGRWPNIRPRAPARTGAAEEIRVPIGRADMAQYIGARTETLSRTIKQLARTGAVEDREPGLFVVRDLARLVAESGAPDYFEAAAAEPGLRRRRG